MVDPGSLCTAHSFQPPHVLLPSCPFAGGPDSSGLFTPGKIRESALQTGLMYQVHNCAHFVYWRGQGGFVINEIGNYLCIICV